MVAVGIPIPVLISLGRYAVDYKITAVISVKTSDNIEQCGLARAARTQNGNKFIVTQVQADVVKSLLH